MPTKLILLESVDGLGRPGDLVKVKPGFARNYLIPQRKAVVATEDSKRMLGKLQAKAEAEERALISSMEEMANKIAGLKLSVEARATDDGHLFGSVTEKDIHLAIRRAGWDVSLRAVRLPMHLKDAGLHDVTLHLYAEITSAIQVEVVPIDNEGNRIDPKFARAEGDAHDETDDDEATGDEVPAAAGDQAAAAAKA